MDQQIRLGLRWAAGLGLGVGLMLGAAAGSIWQKPAVTDAQVIERARQLGMTEGAQGQSDAVPGDKGTASDGGGAPTPGSGSGSAPSADGGNSEPSVAGSASAPSTVRTVAYNVSPGMSFEEIADLLQEAGAIEDRSAFLARAGELGAMEQAKPGLYILRQADATRPISFDEIIQQLVQGPSR